MPHDLRGAADDGVAHELSERAQRRIVTAIRLSGEAYLSNAYVEGRYMLRVCIVNFRTTLEDVAVLPDLVTRLGRELDAQLRPYIRRAHRRLWEAKEVGCCRVDGPQPNTVARVYLGFTPPDTRAEPVIAPGFLRRAELVGGAGRSPRDRIQKGSECSHFVASNDDSDASAASLRIPRPTSSRDSGSTPRNGSSESRQRGLRAIEMARIARRSSPPESVDGYESRNSSNLRSSTISR